MRRFPILILVWLAFRLQGADSRGHLLYLGCTSNAWQVCLLDLNSGKSAQLTTSPGDKRRPMTTGGTTFVFFRDTLGQILGYVRNSMTEHPIFTPWFGCGHFCLGRDGTTVFFTRLAADNRQRQFLWSQGQRDTNAVLVYRPDRGAVCHPVVSPDGNWIAATQISRAREERLLVLSFKADGSPKLLTPEFTEATTPCWRRDGKAVYFAWRKPGGSFDLCLIEIDTGTITPILETPDTAELYPTLDSPGRCLYFEQRTDQGSALARLDLESHRVTRLPLDHEAREPFWCE
jgi:hypothetical protein